MILGLTFYSVIMVPFNLAVNRTFSNEDISLVVVDSIVDVIFFIDIIFNFHTSFVEVDGTVIVDQVSHLPSLATCPRQSILTLQPFSRL